MNVNFKTIIDEDGFVRLPIRIHGPLKRSIKLIGIVDTASSYTIIPLFAANYLAYPYLIDKAQKSRCSQEAATYRLHSRKQLKSK